MYTKERIALESLIVAVIVAIPTVSTWIGVLVKEHVSATNPPNSPGTILVIFHALCFGALTLTIYCKNDYTVPMSLSQE